MRAIAAVSSWVASLISILPFPPTHLTLREFGRCVNRVATASVVRMLRAMGRIAAKAEASKEAEMAKRDEVKARVCPEARTRRADLGLLALRVTAGGLVPGHGAQKLFGAFGGHGLEGTAGWLESIGMKPGKVWAALAGASEFGGGTMTALGLGGPIG